MFSAKKFYEENVKKQRDIINDFIKKCATSGNPIVFLPFDTYPIIEKEMLESGWIYEAYYDKGHKCASFYTKQYCDGE